jgi:hypothetical protein
MMLASMGRRSPCPISPWGNVTADELASTQNATLFRFTFLGVLCLRQVSELRTHIGDQFFFAEGESERTKRCLARPVLILRSSSA